MSATRVLAVLLLAAGIASGQPAPEPSTGPQALAALGLADSVKVRVERLERLVAGKGRVEAVLAEAAALRGDFKKARGVVNWAATQGEQGGREGASKVAETAGEAAARIAKLVPDAPPASRETLKKLVRAALRTRKECEKRIAELDTGVRPDPFAEFMMPMTPAAPKNPSRDAQIERSGK
ncbi:MAG: hypothetical protein WC943_02285 [Elusimicrobiota bacterium]